LTPEALFQLSGDEELLGRSIVFNAQYIWLATNLAVFDVTLPPTGGRIDGRGVPLSAGRALKSGLHQLVTA
jgi:hypothetical protein